MNIALFASAFHPSLGGVEELCRQLAMELMRQGHHVIILTNRWPRDLPATDTIDGISVYRLPFRLPEGSAKAAINYHLTHRGIEREMLSILRKHQINMLHVQCVSSNTHYAMIAQKKLNLPLVVTLQGELTMDANQIFQKSPQAQEILRRALDQAQVITACSAKTLRDGEEFYGKPFGDRGRVIFNGVNLADFVAAPEVTRLAGQGAGRGLDGDDHHKDTTTRRGGGNHKEVAEGYGDGDGGLRDTGLAGQRVGCGLDVEFTTKTQRHDDGTSKSDVGTHKEVAEGSGGGDGGLRDTGLAGQRAGRGLDVEFTTKTQRHDDGTPKSEVGAHKEVGLAGQPAGRGPAGAGPTESAALPNNSRFEVPGSDSPSRRPYILSLGRLAPQKGFHTLIEAFAKSGLAASMDLVIGGDGAEMYRLHDLTAQSGIAERVCFAGRLDRKAVASYLQSCEFFVLASPAEPFGIVVTEAMAVGAPVIAVNNAGPAEIITDGVNGLLVERSEPELLAAAMQRLNNDPVLRSRLAVAGKARAAEFAWPKVASEYLSAYAAAGSYHDEPQRSQRTQRGVTGDYGLRV
ncbi:MAG: glycosyltransferase [Planctomycetes bacterium]|nr:glycosyltransferase [Planctomycetota bacterium]